MIDSINPYNDHVLQSYPEMTEKEIESILGLVQKDFLQWRRSGLDERKKCLLKLAQLLLAGEEKYAHLMACEMGKPVSSGISEVKKCALNCQFYAENGENFLRPEIIPTEARKSYVTFNPLGIILAIMPWNFPFWQVFRFAVPTLMAGNACLLKHASNVPGCALEIESLFREAGLPENLFRTILIGGAKIQPVIAHPLVQAVTLTGSVAAGKKVAQMAGAHLKKSVLELGGSDPAIVLEDADLNLAAQIAVSSRLQNAGQSCIAAKRFIVMEKIRKQFEDICMDEMRKIRMGDPLDKETQLGPLAKKSFRADLHLQVEKSRQMGAVCLFGGEIPDGPGAFYPPTLLTKVGPGMPAYEDELFGPVAAIIPVTSEEEALAVANHPTFGLGATVFTCDLEKGERWAGQLLEAGSCFVNQMVRSDPRLPFGGIKQSGFGRELSHYGIKEFVNIKTVLV